MRDLRAQGAQPSHLPRSQAERKVSGSSPNTARRPSPWLEEELSAEAAELAALEREIASSAPEAAWRADLFRGRDGKINQLGEDGRLRPYDPLAASSRRRRRRGRS